MAVGARLDIIDLDALAKALPTDADGISHVAAQTFSLACPADTPKTELQTYIDENLTPSCFATKLLDSNVDVRVLEDRGNVIGFSLVTLAPEPLDSIETLS